MEVKQNIIVTKTFNFSKQIIKLYISLKRDKVFELASQLIRSATSIGANVEEAQAAQSKRDFISKMSIAAKEARETRYWLRLLHETEITEKEVEHLLKEVEEIINILTKIVKTSSTN
ncbi:MAG: four helix bundle protein [Sphingobacteriaceae bacterium]|nr:four helix bundle protein [Sphingobacteriaceae bacterium]MBK7817630.1 four helix bundle protein [Sphingobacteriaceae bacterium]